MAANLLDGKELAAGIERQLAADIAAARAGGRRAPGLAVLRVGDDPASLAYVRNKERACLAAGMVSKGEHLQATTSAAQLLARIRALNDDPGVDGILLQLPLPAGIDARPLLQSIDPEKDVDGFHPENAGRLLEGHPRFVPCTPRGIMRLLTASGVTLAGARAVVVGRSNIVGKPIALLLLSESATVTICHSRTRDLLAATRQADVLVAAVGSPGLIGGDAIRSGSVVIDVGVNRVTDPAVVGRLVRDERRLAAFARNGSLLVGDVRFEEATEVAGHLTPVPGGVGPLTVAMLLLNTWEGYLRRFPEPASGRAPAAGC